MPQLSAIDTVSIALEHTKRQLFRPFRWGQWLRLALLGFMTGELSSGGGCGGNFPTSLPTNPQDQRGGADQFLSAPHLDPQMAAHIVLIAGVAILAVCVFALAWMYVGSVYRFILIESIITKNVSLRAGWRKWHATGRRFFLWRLVYQFAIGFFAVILIGIPLGIAAVLGWLKDPHAHMLPLVFGGIILFFLVLIFFLGAAVVWLLGKDFVAPIMALENLDFADSWSRLFEMMKKDKGSYAGYVGMKIVLAIAAGILFGILIFLAILVVLLPVGGLGLVAVLTGKAAGLTWNPVTVTLAVLAGTFAFALIMFLSSMLSVPVTVYFPAYSIYFFAARYPKLAAWLYPAPPVSALPPPHVVEPPTVRPPPLGPEPIT